MAACSRCAAGLDMVLTGKAQAVLDIARAGGMWTLGIGKRTPLPGVSPVWYDLATEAGRQGGYARVCGH